MADTGAAIEDPRCVPFRPLSDTSWYACYIEFLSSIAFRPSASRPTALVPGAEALVRVLCCVARHFAAFRGSRAFFDVDC